MGGRQAQIASTFEERCEVGLKKKARVTRKPRGKDTKCKLKYEGTLPCFYTPHQHHSHSLSLSLELSLPLLSIFIIQDATPVVYGYVRFMSFLAPSSVCVRVCVCVCVNSPTLKQIAFAVGC